MILYHSSYLAIDSPDVLHSRDNLDFGKGFYLTSLRDQADNYALRFKRRKKDAWVNIYSFDFESTDWNILEFPSYNGEWLEFISNCRAGNDMSNYDLIIGGIANDKVLQTLDRYFEGELSSEQALGILRYEKPNIQFCIRSQEMMDKCLKFIESIKL